MATKQMFEKWMRRLGWVRATGYDELLVKYVDLLDRHEKLLRLAKVLNERLPAPTAPGDVAEAQKASREEADRPRGPKPAHKLH